MKTIPEQLKIGLLCLLVVHISMVFFYQKVLMKNTSQQRKETLYDNLKTKPEILFMGDSHPLKDINPRYFPNAFNWGGSSENYILNYFKLKYLLKKGWKPKVIFLSTEMHSLSAQGQQLILNHELDDTYWRNKINPREIDAIVGGTSYTRWWITANFAPYAGQFYHLKNLFSPTIENLSQTGYAPGNQVWEMEENRNEKLNALTKSHFGKYEIADSVQIVFLKKFKSLCAGENIRLVPIQYPVHFQYLQSAGKQINVTQMDSILSQSVKPNGMIKLRNLFDRHPVYFSDPDHLNTKGAQIFSQWLWKNWESFSSGSVE